MTSSSLLTPLSSNTASALGALAGKKERAKATDTTTAGSAATSTTSASSQTSLSSLGSTFLKLLTEELQNQDPTAPMDSTQMVGQMISLNQLDQLASINQLLTTQFDAASTTTNRTSTPAS